MKLQVNGPAWVSWTVWALMLFMTILVIDCLIPILILGENILPAWSVYITLGIVLIDIAYMIYASNVKCKKQ